MGWPARITLIPIVLLIAPSCIPPFHDPSPPSAPTALVAVAVSTGRVDLTWTDTATREFGFRIERSDDGGTTYSPIGFAPANSSAFVDMGLLPATPYTYRIYATNSGGNSGFAGPVTAVTQTPGWSSASMAGGPTGALMNHSAVYDEVGQRMLVFGGLDDLLTVYNDLWSFDLSSATLTGSTLWSKPTSTGITPPFRAAHSAIVDALNRRLLVFGGMDDVFVFRNEVFILDLATLTWSQPTVTGVPPVMRAYHTAVYDSARQQMIVYGGNDGVNELADVHFLSLPDAGPFAWSSSVVAPGPVGRERHAAVYDPMGDRMVIFGGLDNNGVLDGSVLSTEAWALNLNGAPSWIPLTTVGGPGFRMGSTGVYDDVNRRMVIFGGDTTTFSNVSAEARALFMGTPEAWMLLLPSASLPAPRYDHSAIYDIVFKRMVIYGGWNGTTTSYNDVWVSSF